VDEGAKHRFATTVASKAILRLIVANREEEDTWPIKEPDVQLMKASAEEEEVEAEEEEVEEAAAVEASTFRLLPCPAKKKTTTMKITIPRG
jgi:hypothetical protein